MPFFIFAMIALVISGCASKPKQNAFAPINATASMAALPPLPMLAAKEELLAINYSFDNETGKDLVLVDQHGKPHTFKREPMDGACGENFIDINAIYVDARKIVWVDDNKELTASRPKDLKLDKMRLLNAAKKVLVEVEVPQQTFPLGVIAKENAIVISYNSDGALAISKNKKWLVNKKDFSTKGQWLKGYIHPDKSKEKNSYLSYEQFPSGHIVEFSGPCT